MTLNSRTIQGGLARDGGFRNGCNSNRMGKQTIRERKKERKKERKERKKENTHIQVHYHADTQASTGDVLARVPVCGWEAGAARGVEAKPPVAAL